MSEADYKVSLKDSAPVASWFYALKIYVNDEHSWRGIANTFQEKN